MPRLGDVPFDEWAATWLATKAPQLRESSVDLYRYLLRRHIVPGFGTTPVNRLTPVHVQRWLAGLHEHTRLSPNSVAKAYRIMKAVMEGAVDARLIPRNPCSIKGAGTEHHEEMQIATPEQVAAIAAAVGPRWRRSSSPPPTAVCAGASSPAFGDATSTSSPTRSRSLGSCQK